MEEASIHALLTARQHRTDDLIKKNAGHTVSIEPIRNCHVTKAVPLQDTSPEEVQSFNYLQENLSLPVPARLLTFVKVWDQWLSGL